MRLNPFEEVHSDLTLIRKPSPLPWLLLLFVVAMGAGMMWMAWGRLTDERRRSAEALKASDEVVARLRVAQSEGQKLQAELTAMTQKKADLDGAAATLKAQLGARDAELTELKSRCKK